MHDQHTPTDPTRQHPDDQGPEQQSGQPGRTGEMERKPDHGEDTYRGSGKLTGKRAVITGGDSGIGRAVALAFAREGADILFTYLPGEDADARESVRLVEDAGRKAIAVGVDLRDERACQTLIERAMTDLGAIDVLVNNAAYQLSRDDGILAIDSEQLDRTFRTNVFAMFWLTRAAVPHLRPGSAIINTSSIQAYQPSPQLMDYAMTKAAIVSFTKSLALQLAERGVRVNTVAPGPIWTPLIPATMPAAKVDDFGADTPLGRAGQPAEVAPAYVFLASQESSYVTGERIGVAGGRSMA
jgi:NAD(P)-dependent dehydrogenase (short-subunit alcohol dehydrogenase family)